MPKRELCASCGQPIYDEKEDWITRPHPGHVGVHMGWPVPFHFPCWEFERHKAADADAAPGFWQKVWGRTP